MTSEQQTNTGVFGVWLAGALAGREGKTLEDNPYEPRTALAMAWRWGWEAWERDRELEPRRGVAHG